MNSFALANQSPVSALRERPVGQARVPSYWHADRTAIDELDDQRIGGHCHPLRSRPGRITP